jgi:hypothetical protein
MAFWLLIISISNPAYSPFMLAAYGKSSTDAPTFSVLLETGLLLGGTTALSPTAPNLQFDEPAPAHFIVSAIFPDGLKNQVELVSQLGTVFSEDNPQWHVKNLIA